MLTALQNCAGDADRFVVVDTETTGVYPSDRIVEISIITLSTDGAILDTYDTLIQPQRDVSATHIHGITASMVADAPTFAEIAGDIAVRLHGACFVAHNVPFDSRMLANEFGRLNAELTVLRGIDTLAEAGCRLGEACAVRGITHDVAHRALNDATATAELFLRLADSCDKGAAVVAPFGLARSGRVRRREDTERVNLPDPPLIVYLASRLPHSGVEVRSLAYLELLGRAIGDLHLDLDERRSLGDFARELGLTEAEVVQAHRRYLNDLIDAAVEDDEVTDEEYDALVRVAAALDIDQVNVETRINPYRTNESSVTLAQGMSVVFTGDHASHTRDDLQARIRAVGLVPQSIVSKAIDIVAAADPESNSGKAALARRYGIPIVAVDDLIVARIGDSVLCHGAGQVALKVITCPDCRATWTVPATDGRGYSKRCDHCAEIAAGARKPYKAPNKPKPIRDMWAPPVVELLTCHNCGATWIREVVKGRKPHFCPTCTANAG